MRDVLDIARALSDEARLRALLALRGGELCVCQIIELLGLAPSTVSRHMSILADAALVRRRKEGRWHYYRLADADNSSVAAQALQWVRDALADEPLAVADAQKLCCVLSKDLKELCACYNP